MTCRGLRGRNNDSQKVGMRLEIVRIHTLKCTYKGRKEFRKGMCHTTICQGSKAETSCITRPGPGRPRPLNRTHVSLPRSHVFTRDVRAFWAETNRQP